MFILREHLSLHLGILIDSIPICVLHQKPWRVSQPQCVDVGVSAAGSEPLLLLVSMCWGKREI